MKNNQINYMLIALLGLIIILFVALIYIVKPYRKPQEIQTETPVSSAIEENDLANDMPESEEIINPGTEENTDVNEPVSEETPELTIFNTPFSDGYEFPDLSDYDFVFIGDSIFEMGNSKTSMPRQLEVYTNARVYNLSKNGSCAGNNSSGYISLSGLTQCFLNGVETGSGENKSFNVDIERFVNDKHSKKKLVIIINHCINDYIFGTNIANPDDLYDIDTYEGALRTNIGNIINAYPKAEILYMEPYVLAANDYGYEQNSRHFTIYDYVSSLEKIAGEYGIKCFNLRAYTTYAEYRDGYLLDDGIHPNDMCSKTIARLLCDYVENHLK